MTGGGAASYFYAKRSTQHLSTRNGLRMGWLTGLFCFVIFLVTTTVEIMAVSMDKGVSQFFGEQLKLQHGPKDEVEQIIKLLQTPEGLGAFLFVLVIAMFILFTLLPTIGGAIGAKFSERE